MKPEYKDRALQNVDSVKSRINVVIEMLRGQRPANTQEATKLLNETIKLVELTENIIQLS